MCLCRQFFQSLLSTKWIAQTLKSIPVNGSKEVIPRDILHQPRELQKIEADFDMITMLFEDRQ
ncbi:hypothetical protein NSQ95_01960 [Psychrobacillus sp. FSL W7-1457]|uniref:hypothetical protein n=1 Tax=Psychrobacillus sp. FSL W7-1457 TaxID=2954547 RepID=UPI00315A003F